MDILILMKGLVPINALLLHLISILCWEVLPLHFSCLPRRCFDFTVENSLHQPWGNVILYSLSCPEQSCGMQRCSLAAWCPHHHPPHPHLKDTTRTEILSVIWRHSACTKQKNLKSREITWLRFWLQKTLNNYLWKMWIYCLHSAFLLHIFLSCSTWS